MNEKNANAYELKRLRMPITISSISKNNETNRQSIDPNSMFSLTMHQGMEISNGIGGYLKKHNIFDFSYLHEDPDRSAFDRLFAFSLLYKSELGNLEETAADNATASLVCGKSSEEFFKYLNESGYSIIKYGSGIYRVNILLINIYIIVMSELEEPEYSWMGSLIKQAGGKCKEMRINGMECSFRIAEF